MSKQSKQRGRYGVARAIAVAGGQAALARRLGVTRQAVENWRARGAPAKWCPAIEAVTRALGAPVLCEEMRPDVDWGVIRGTRSEER